MKQLVIAAVGAILLLGIGAGLVIDSRHEDDPTLKAEFETARGLLKGNDVRVRGVKAGRVEAAEVTSRGTALVTMRLDEELPAPRADAVATIRPVDLLGDVYLSLSLGHSEKRLRGPIPVKRTSNVSRLADLLRAFRPGARTGLRATLVEMGLALERRGVDLNSAAVELRPALKAADEMMREVSSQNASLRSLIPNSGRVVRQLAGQERDLGRSVDGFAATVRATAEHSVPLARGLDALPPTLAQLRGTAGRLADTATAARPLAATLRDAAPQLAVAMRRLRPFLREAAGAARRTGPTLRRTASFLDAGRETFPLLRSGLARLRGAAPETDALMDALVPIAPLASELFFVKVADQGSEPGTQPFDPFTDPRRRYWRGAAVMSCESFGVKIAPGCLEGYLRTSARRRQRRPRGGGSRPSLDRRRPDRGALRRVAPVQIDPRDAPAAERPGAALPGVPKDDRLDGLLDYLLGP